jgi:dTDP-4-amino-4,6-dideoxygalactose transaminase
MTEAAPIPQTDPRAGYLAQKAEIDAAIMQVLESGQYILGRAVERFEGEFAAYLGLAHGIGCASGTDALELALRACGIGEGHLVFTVSHTAVATVAAIERAGAKPVLVDIEPGGFAMDPAALDAALRDPPPGRPAAILPVHLYGEPADLAAIGEIARVQSLRVIEDCAQSHGAVYRRRPVGSFGDIACFSFYPTKNLGALGDAGIIATEDAALAEVAREIREYGWRERYVSARSGINTRLDPVQAVVLSVKLPRLEGLAGLPIGLPRRRPETSPVFHQYVIRSKDRDRLRENLRTASIGTGVHYPVPVHLHPAYRSRVALGPTGLRNSEKAAGEILSLPIYPQLADDAVDRVIGEIRKFFD